MKRIRAFNFFAALLVLTTTLRGTIPQIDIDNVDPAILEYAIYEYGCFELVGKSINTLSKTALDALDASKKLFNLPISELQKVPYNTSDAPMHGFHNEFADSIAQQRQIQNHFAFYVRPYLSNRVPEGANIEPLRAYYYEGMKVLYKLYDHIATLYIDKKDRTQFDDDSYGILTLRKYFDSTYGETVFVPHTDFSKLGLGISDEPGFELYHKGEWIRAPWQPLPRFMVTIGDWLRFQAKNKKFADGLHRVTAVKKERHFLGLFLNPHPDQQLETVDGKIQNFHTYIATANKYKDLPAADTAQSAF